MFKFLAGIVIIFSIVGLTFFDKNKENLGFVVAKIEGQINILDSDI